jgi:hypothetical protein
MFFETGSNYVDQAIFQLLILLPQTPECWDYRYQAWGNLLVHVNTKKNTQCSDILLVMQAMRQVKGIEERT